MWVAPRARRRSPARADSRTGHQTVAEPFQYVAAKARHRLRSRVEIGPDQFPPILRVEPRRKAGRADEIAEHTGDGRRSAASELAPTGTWRFVGTAFTPSARAEEAALSCSIADMILRRWPTMATPRSLRSSTVSFGSTSPSTSLSRNAASYCPRPRLRSQTPTSSVHGVGLERRL